MHDGPQRTLRGKATPGVQLCGWQEYGNYLGWFGAALALGSAGWIVVFRRRREHWREGASAFALVVVILLTAGEFATYAPATLLRHVPLLPTRNRGCRDASPISSEPPHRGPISPGAT